MTSDSPAPLRFSELGLPDVLVQATDDAGFSHCTDIQALTLPTIIEGHDVAAQAQTGTGKTAAFLLGSMTLLLQKEGAVTRQKNQPRMLVIAPTRELAIQIFNDAEQLGQHTDFKFRVVYGGADYEKQRLAVEAGVDVLIGTPGRLIDYFKKKAFDLKALEIVVLDEADRMFDLGFIADIRFLLRRMPSPDNRTSMLFSATLSNRVMELAYEHMNSPRAIEASQTGDTAEGVEQFLFQPATDEKVSLLVGLIRKLTPSRTIVFVNTKRASETVEGYLLGNGIQCGTLSGDVRQKRRQRILADFTAGKLPVLIATDVAARGLHINDVTHVFNFDLPQQAEDYVHRIGRTARAGTTGEALSFACEKYSFSLPDIQEYIGQSIPVAPITNDILPELDPPAKIEKREAQSQNSRNQSGRKQGGRSPGGRKQSSNQSGNKGRSGQNRRGRSENGQKSGESSGKPSSDGAKKDHSDS